MAHGIFWACPECGGRALSVELLRRTFTNESINPFWRRVIGGPAIGHRACPCCGRRMLEVALADKSNSPQVDVCRLCHFVWFDANEMADLAPRPLPMAPPQLPAEARQAIALVEVQRMAEQAAGSDLDSAPPDEWWKQFAAFFGVPVEFDAPAQETRPWITWLLCLTIALVGIATASDLQTWVNEYGLIPAQAGRHGGLTFVTSFFLHAGVIHLLGNLYFLFVFGDNVEDFLRWPRYLLLLVVATLAGDLLHIAIDPRANIPSIGASGGIAGVIVFYALQFPHIRLGFLFRYWFYFRWIRLPAWFALVLWVAFQLIGAVQQLAGMTSVSSLAHLGGAVGGAARVAALAAENRLTFLQNAGALPAIGRARFQNLEVQLRRPGREEIFREKNIHRLLLPQPGRANVGLENFPVLRIRDIEIGCDNPAARLQDAARFLEVKKRFLLQQVSEDGKETNHLRHPVGFRNFRLRHELEAPARSCAFLRRELEHFRHDVDPEITDRVAPGRLCEGKRQPAGAAADIDQVIVWLESEAHQPLAQRFPHDLVIAPDRERHRGRGIVLREQGRHMIGVREPRVWPHPVAGFLLRPALLLERALVGNEMQFAQQAFHWLD